MVFTYELDTTKVDGQNPDTKLEGAEFRLFKGEAGQDGKVAEANRQYVKITDGKVSGWTEAGVTEGAATLTSDKEGLFVITTSKRPRLPLATICWLIPSRLLLLLPSRIMMAFLA